MIKTILTRFMRLAVIGIICSLPIRLLESGTTGSPGPILILSLLLFTGLTGFDTYAFSKAYWKLPDIIFGIFIPLILYIAFNITSLFWMPASIYNYMFLPFRSAELVCSKSVLSIILINIFIIILSIVLGIIASVKGKRLYEQMDIDDIS